MVVGLPFTAAIIMAFYGLANLRQVRYRPVNTARQFPTNKRSIRTLEEELKLFAATMPANDDYEMISTRSNNKNTQK